MATVSRRIKRNMAENATGHRNLTPKWLKELIRRVKSKAEHADS